MDTERNDRQHYPLDLGSFEIVSFVSPHPFYHRSFLAVFDGIEFPIYRYTKTPYAEDFFNSGKIRLNTIRSYHDIEKLGNVVGDRLEGFRYHHSFVDGSVGGEIGDVSTVFYGDSVNAWALCCSRVKGKHFFGEFNADCCLEIMSIEYFLEIANASTSRWQAGSLAPMNYLDTGEIINAVLKSKKTPMLNHTKPRLYEWQQEVRLILEPWSPIQSQPGLNSDEIQSALLSRDPNRFLSRSRLFPNLEPLTLYAPNARKYVKIIETI